MASTVKPVEAFFLQSPDKTIPFPCAQRMADIPYKCLYKNGLWAIKHLLVVSQSPPSSYSLVDDDI